MDLSAYPAPPNDPDPDDPAAEEAFYRAGLKRFSQIALRLADQIEAADELSLPEKAETIDRVARIFRRNARVARHLREPLRVGSAAARSSTAPTRRFPRTADGQIDYAKISDADLEVLGRLETLERLEQLEPVDARARDRDLSHLGARAEWPNPEPTQANPLDPAPAPSRHVAPASGHHPEQGNPTRTNRNPLPTPGSDTS